MLLQMNATTVIPPFDLFRLSRAKQVCDLSPNTLREYAKEGLPLYRRKGDRAVFVSRAELESFLKAERVPV